jgi:tRNA threonylcarbamoyladenosine dehydratase
MIKPIFERTQIIAGTEGIEQFKHKRILIAGLGGVGSFAAESIARMGIGTIYLVDHDVVSASNLNRQLVALESTIGMKKVEVMAERIRDINPECEVIACDHFLREADIIELFEHQSFDFVIDAIDSLASKVSLLKIAHQYQIKTVSSMGAGNRIDPAKILTADISKTHTCPLARKIRLRLRRLGVKKGITAVFSSEIPSSPLPPEPVSCGRPRAVNGTVSYMPAIFGLTMTGVIVKSLLQSR